MDQIQVLRLKEAYGKGLQSCQEKIEKCEKFQADYEQLKTTLQSLPNALSYDITVPFGSNAFAMGKLVHTNELMVLLGDNWYAEVSQKQATEILNRRIKKCADMLQGLEAEKNQFKNWMTYIDDVSGNENLVDIVEPYDEEQEKKWREEHAKNVKAYHQKLAEERRNMYPNSSSIEDLQKGLEELQIPKDDSKTADSDEAIFEFSDDNSEEHSSKPSTLKLNINVDNKASVESETGEDDVSHVTESSDTHLESDVHLEGESPDSVKHVRWLDMSKQRIQKITFKHSKNRNNKQFVKHQDSVEKDETTLIQSPSDIYKQFGNFFPASPPKSILKVKFSPPTDVQEPFFPPKEEVIPHAPIIKSNPVLSFEVKERSTPIDVVEKERPTSHFRNSRKNRRR